MPLPLEYLEHNFAVQSPLNLTPNAQMQIFTMSMSMSIYCQGKGLKSSVGLTQAPTQITRPVIHSV